MDDHDLLLVGSVVEDIAARLREGEGEDGRCGVTSCILSRHFFLKDLEGTKVEDVVRVHHTVLHVNWVVNRARDIEHERVTLPDTVHWIEDLLLRARLNLESSTIDVVDELTTDLVAQSPPPLNNLLDGLRDSIASLKAIVAEGD